MDVNQGNRVGEQLGRLLAFGITRDLSDGQLLERFATAGGERAEQAFAALVERHGPMVLRVCRSVLNDAHSAEDAFQATFLVLARKGRRLWVEESLGPWLHQVALRTASCARRGGARRRRHERDAAAARATTSLPDPGGNSDLERLLHEELERLPDRFRVPLILCDLQGLTQEHVARHLGFPVGTVKSRLSRARERLRRRLLRRGYSPGSVVAALPRPILPDALLPSFLLRSSASAAIRFAASRGMHDAPAAVLAQGVLSAMSMTRWWKAACLLLVAGATVSGAGLLGGGTQAVEPKPQDPGKPAADMPVAAATKGLFQLVMSEPGTVEASKREEFLSRLDAPSRIIRLVPEGTMVKKGEVVCELDSTSLRERLSGQMRTTQTAEASYQQARLAREVAELAVKEYEEGIALSESALVRGEVKLNESAFERASQRLDRMRRAREKLNALQARQEAGSIGEILAEVDLEDRFDSAEQGLARQRFSLEQAQARLNQFENYTKPKNIRVLRIEREKAISEELAKEQALKLELQNQSNLEKQIAACSLTAGIDGMVVHANPPKQEGQRYVPAIRRGAEVRPRQIIVRILSLDAPMRFLAKISEAMADLVKSGQKAKVRVDAFPNETFTGVMDSIAPLADPQPFTARDLKVYSTWIELENPIKAMRPGMTGRAEVTVLEREDVLTVPTDAIESQQGKHQVAVRKPDGSFTWREVVVGDVDPASKRIEIKQGLEPGEQVATDLPQLLKRGFNAPTAK